MHAHLVLRAVETPILDVYVQFGQTPAAQGRPQPLPRPRRMPPVCRGPRPPTVALRSKAGATARSVRATSPGRRHDPGSVPAVRRPDVRLAAWDSSWAVPSWSGLYSLRLPRTCVFLPPARRWRAQQVNERISLAPCASRAVWAGSAMDHAIIHSHHAWRDSRVAARHDLSRSKNATCWRLPAFTCPGPPPLWASTR